VSDNVYLVGMPGSGKSRTGRELARRLRRRFVDLDRAIETAAGKRIKEIFETLGEEAFRSLETEALTSASAGRNQVVSCGGGIVLDPGNRKLMGSTGTVVWLSVPVDKLLARAPAGGKRPLLRSPEDMSRLLAEREDLYREVADVIVDGSRETEQVAEAIVEALTWNG